MKNSYTEGDNPATRLIEEALNSIKTLVDVDTVIGKPFEMGDKVVAYPIIKITIGLVAGGGEYSNKLKVKSNNSFPFAGGTGTGFTAEPIGFLIVKGAEHELISIQNKTAWTNVMNKLGDGLSEYLKSIAKKTKKEA